MRRYATLGVSAAAVALALVLLNGNEMVRSGEGMSGDGHVPCPESGASCGARLQEAIDTAAPGSTITLEPGRVYEGAITLNPKPGASAEKLLTITTRGWSSKGEGWEGLVTPADKPRMAVIRGAARSVAAIDVRSGPSSGFVKIVGVAFDATPPNGQGDVIRIGSGRDSDPSDLPRHVTIREVLIQGSREYGQKRAVAANGQDITIDRLWCEEIFAPGQDSQCVGAWNGGHRVSIRHSYLAAGSENIMVGGAPVTTTAMQPSDWTIEDVILHKPLRWKQDARNRAVKNLLELKHGTRITVRRVLAVNNWRAAQSGRGLVIHYTTNGSCPACGNLEKVVIEDLVMLNVEGGVSLQGYSWQTDSNSAGRLRDVTLRHLFVQIAGDQRLLEIANVHGRHNIRIERSTLLNDGTSWLMGDFGLAWSDGQSRGPGGAMQGLWIVDNVIAANGRYGVTAPQGHHYGEGLGKFAVSDLQIAGNVIGDAPPAHLANYNRHTNTGADNIGVERAALLAKLSPRACENWQPGKGADCARLTPVFALLERLPEP
jgi:hypothetical protein